VIHEFLYLPECPIPLLGRDLLTKPGAQITFNQGGPANPHEGTKCHHHGSNHAYGRRMETTTRKRGTWRSPSACWRSFLMSGLRTGPQSGSLSWACNGRTQAWGFPCQSEAVSGTMESMTRNSDPPTMAEGCRDINRLPITMEHPTAACQKGPSRSSGKSTTPLSHCTQ
jgi:hypothetical protein